MVRVEKIDLPAQALLGRYRQAGMHTDCYRADVSAAVSLPAFVEAFYTTPLFKSERAVLRFVARRPSTDQQAREVARGTRNDFAAWTVEDRADDQLLMCDMHGRTRSWFMVAPAGDGRTALYFGSAVVPNRTTADGTPQLSLGFRALMGFHHWYSVALLKAAVRGLRNS